MKSLYERLTENLEFQYWKLDEEYKDKDYNNSVYDYIEYNFLTDPKSSRELVEKISDEIDEMFEEFYAEMKALIEYDRWAHEYQT